MAHYTYFDTTWKGKPVRFITGSPELEQANRIEQLFERFRDCGRVVIIRTLEISSGGTTHHDGDIEFARDFTNNYDYNKLRKPQRGTI